MANKWVEEEEPAKMLRRKRERGRRETRVQADWEFQED